MRQKIILLGFIEVMDLVDEEDRGLSQAAQPPGIVDNFLEIFDAGGDGGKMNADGARRCRENPRQRRFAARFGAKDLDDASSRHAEAAQGDVERQAAGGNAGDLESAIASEGHDRTFAELLFDLLEGRFEG